MFRPRVGHRHHGETAGSELATGNFHQLPLDHFRIHEFPQHLDEKIRAAQGRKPAFTDCDTVGGFKPFPVAGLENPIALIPNNIPAKKSGAAETQPLIGTGPNLPDRQQWQRRG